MSPVSEPSAEARRFDDADAVFAFYTPMDSFRKKTTVVTASIL
jgi:hypothetical protein